jgi:hypothetical protein
MEMRIDKLEVSFVGTLPAETFAGDFGEHPSRGRA